jgi:ribonuclease D
MAEATNQPPATPEAVEPAPVLPLLASPRNPNVVMVTSIDGLTEAVAELAANTGPIALDAERASGFKYSARAYLVQVARGKSPIYLIDPFAIAPEVDASLFADLAAVLATDVWILHAATQDLACLAELGLRPTKLFDTELGGRLANIPRVGLGTMCESLLGFRLAKEHSAVDWSTRPLQDDWLNYAALDIDVLFELMDAVSQQLETQGKQAFAQEEFDYLINWHPKGPKIDKWRGMTGLHEVKDQRKLAVARELWSAREALAQKLDVSPGRLIPDGSIVSVVKDTPRSRSELAGRRDFHGRASRTYLDTWWRALEVGMNTLDLPPVKIPHVGIPNHRNWANRFPEADARLNKLKPVMASVAHAAQMPAENVLTPDFLRQLAWEPPVEVTAATVAEKLISVGARNWQAQLCAEGFAAALTTEVTSA